jgi:hypothetical protein
MSGATSEEILFIEFADRVYQYVVLNGGLGRQRCATHEVHSGRVHSTIRMGYGAHVREAIELACWAKKQ